MVLNSPRPLLHIDPPNSLGEVQHAQHVLPRQWREDAEDGQACQGGLEERLEHNLRLGCEEAVNVPKPELLLSALIGAVDGLRHLGRIQQADPRCGCAQCRLCLSVFPHLMTTSECLRVRKTPIPATKLVLLFSEAFWEKVAYAMSDAEHETDC